MTGWYSSKPRRISNSAAVPPDPYPHPHLLGVWAVKTFRNHTTAPPRSPTSPFSNVQPTDFHEAAGKNSGLSVHCHPNSGRNAACGGFTHCQSRQRDLLGAEAAAPAMLSSPLGSPIRTLALCGIDIAEMRPTLIVPKPSPRHWGRDSGTAVVRKQQEQQDVGIYAQAELDDLVKASPVLLFSRFFVN